MNIVVFAEYFQLADVTAPRHIHVWLHRNGMMVLMGYTGEEMFEKVFFLALTKPEDTAQNEILLRAVMHDDFFAQVSFDEARKAAGTDFADWFSIGDEFRRVEEYESAEGARQLSDVARMLRIQAETLSAKQSYAATLAFCTARCKEAEAFTDRWRSLRFG